MRKSLLITLGLVLVGILASPFVTSQIKAAAESTTMWEQTYGGTKDDYAYSVVQTSDGGYAIAGSTNSFGAGGNDFWLVKTDADGNMQWNKTFGGPEDDQAASIIQTSDGGYAIVGTTWSYGAGGCDAWLIKTDSLGNRQWDKTYGGEKDDTTVSVVQTSDEGYGALL